MSDPAEIVLVHGAFHGAWCWDLLMERLVALGYRARAVDLPGHGADIGPYADLHDDAARVARTLDEATGPVVLVGHSYGGAVITVAGDHPAVSRLVYIAAFALTEDETASTAAPEEAEAAGLSHAGRPDLGAGVTVDGDGIGTLAPASAAAAFYSDFDPELVDWALARLEPQRMANLSTAPGVAAWRTVPSTYVVCENDQAMHPGLQEILAGRCTDTIRWPTGHFPFLSRPDLVTTYLTDLADPAPI